MRAPRFHSSILNINATGEIVRSLAWKSSMPSHEADTQFVQAALAAIRKLGVLVADHPRANHRLDQLVSDLHFVALRYLKGAKCATCDSSTPIPEIVHEVFCSPQCEARHEDKKF